MKNKGFTLVELLTVIILLAIIATIVTPILLTTLTKSKKSTAETSAKEFVKMVENQVMVNDMVATSTSIKNKTYSVSELVKLGLENKGDLPTDDSWVKLQKGNVVECSLQYDNYLITCNNGDFNIEFHVKE